MEKQSFVGSRRAKRASVLDVVSSSGARSALGLEVCIRVSGAEICSDKLSVRVRLVYRSWGVRFG